VDENKGNYAEERDFLAVFAALQPWLVWTLKKQL